MDWVTLIVWNEETEGLPSRISERLQYIKEKTITKHLGFKTKIADSFFSFYGSKEFDKSFK